MSELFAGLHADEYDRTYGNRRLVARILRYLRERRGAMLGSAALVVGAALLTAAVPVVISRVIDQVGGGTGLGLRLSLFVVVAAVLAWVMNWVRQAVTARLVGDVVYRLQCDAADAALAKDVAFYDGNSAGQVMSRVTGDTEGFSSVMTLTLNLLSQVFLVLLLGGVVFWIDVDLGLIILATLPILLGVALAFRRVARTAAAGTRRVMARVNANVHESMLGISVAKSFGREKAVYRDFDEVNRLSYAVYIRQGLIYAVILPVLTMLAGLATAVVLYQGGRFAVLGRLSPGEWYFAIQAFGMLWQPVTQAASFWSLFQQGLAASERVFALIDSEHAIVQHGDEPVTRLDGEIEARGLVFRYGTGATVFDGLDLRIAARETVAIVGHTGGGKSTLAKLIARAYEFQGGELLIDGRDIRSLDLRGYRRRVGVVPQHPFLFAGTLAENIAYGRPGAGHADVERAIERIGHRVWSRSMPLSLHDRLTSGGQGVSVGQRQLIALARMFLQEPDIVLLDEPTASVDPLTERGIQDALFRLFEGRTVLVIAHRLSTIRRADRVLVLREGVIAEDGGFDELLRRGGAFAALYATYYAHQRSA
ncbi:ABC-type multidrug transport system fused ATPase/permease subunit [Streptosporangium becharense]|uniref:ABC-type multidrug transport system fused ATPase/permease subunit n=1 Tax=Streptosporangium becharense TaxID=1816182 RepID=A0A7W9IKM2_9ACTN|nr:ABC transporter ATP-binding protein [Streptosporangium becharense]MBB2911684.1 ABC-type multidrug transport system fused ATPase/permease subunit [Streptosporangium becharense]MBB5822498.1 ABC-type multidrug transport system fused ATPase/permease subunit [Streptosporangium becharense]